ncbi:DNA polymerase III subunit gamma/tau [Alicyclobacillus acidocaldarius]|uniref:DNA-directed DNA polymerase n=1 Tax=Alicyclobacillus acidocaldarius (strain Tc-4-1) TaxID=1048834 RepID=F8IIE8_ALIAT|nr:DNA polymerase III subunit gamma/tau [Alicyclobacillus acidocaldarius]AEJ42107.1 DNA polymerase III, subunits gamma and tau [Alicyclobacillus acidocaldarius subsp. acidocaldarius Tc-4-1]
MAYQALYRAYRPQTFEDLVGQPHVRQTLTNALKSGQLAHAYLFCGPRGTGKTSTAKLLAKAVNCLKPKDGFEPCNACEVCTSIQRGSNVDVQEIDAASNRGVDEIRDLRDHVHYLPTMAKKKVYIVDEVHMLTPEAFNALLKTLEEPPAHVLFVLATTEPHRLPATIISRCQRFDFRRIAPEAIVERLRLVAQSQGIEAADSALWRLAEAADGGLRDALALFEQAAAFGNGRIDDTTVADVVGSVDMSSLVALVGDLAERSFLSALDRLGRWYASGKDASRIVHDLLQVVRDLFIVKLSQSPDALAGKPVAPYLPVASRDDVTVDWLLAAMRRLGELYTQLRYVEEPRLALEAVLMGLAAEVQSKDSVNALESVDPARMGVAVRPEGRPPEQPAQAPDVPVQASAPAPPAPEGAQSTPDASQMGSRPAPARAAAHRKRETLARLYRERDEALEARLREMWQDVLVSVKAKRVQTHAWLLHGEVALATPRAVVLSFKSRIHREAVMKPADRAAVEAALAEVLGQPVQLFAILQADWEEFAASLAPALAEQAGSREAGEAPPVDVVQLAIDLFGADKVTVEDEGDDR